MCGRCWSWRCDTFQTGFGSKTDCVRRPTLRLSAPRGMRLRSVAGGGKKVEARTNCSGLQRRQLERTRLLRKLQLPIGCGGGRSGLFCSRKTGSVLRPWRAAPQEVRLTRSATVERRRLRVRTLSDALSNGAGEDDLLQTGDSADAQGSPSLPSPSQRRRAGQVSSCHPFARRSWARG